MTNHFCISVIFNAECQNYCMNIAKSYFTLRIFLIHDDYSGTGPTIITFTSIGVPRLHSQLTIILENSLISSSFQSNLSSLAFSLIHRLVSFTSASRCLCSSKNTVASIPMPVIKSGKCFFYNTNNNANNAFDRVRY